MYNQRKIVAFSEFATLCFTEGRLDGFAIVQNNAVWRIKDLSAKILCADLETCDLYKLKEKVRQLEGAVNVLINLDEVILANRR